MKVYRPKFSILALMVLIAVAAIAFAVVIARPSRNIRVTVLTNGQVMVGSQTIARRDLTSAVSDEIATRERWLMEAEMQIAVEPEVAYFELQRVLDELTSAGCDEFQLVVFQPKPEEQPDP